MKAWVNPIANESGVVDCFAVRVSQVLADLPICETLIPKRLPDGSYQLKLASRTSPAPRLAQIVPRKSDCDLPKDVQARHNVL
jgi:hypothetical protein